MSSAENQARRRSINWTAIRIHIGVFCIGFAALGYMHTQISNHSASRSAFESSAGRTFGPASLSATIQSIDAPVIANASAETNRTVQSITINKQRYCEQVAIAVLIQHPHEISPEQVRFIRDPRLPGNAIQQFGTAFGYAIETGFNRTSESEPSNP